MVNLKLKFLTQKNKLKLSDTCDGYLDQPRGNIISKYFYETNFTGLMGCIWTANLSSNQSLTLVFDALDVDNDCVNSSLITSANKSKFC